MVPDGIAKIAFLFFGLVLFGLFAYQGYKGAQTKRRRSHLPQRGMPDSSTAEAKTDFPTFRRWLNKVFPSPQHATAPQTTATHTAARRTSVTPAQLVGTRASQPAAPSIAITPPPSQASRTSGPLRTCERFCTLTQETIELREVEGHLHCSAADSCMGRWYADFMANIDPQQLGSHKIDPDPAKERLWRLFVITHLLSRCDPNELNLRTMCRYSLEGVAVTKRSNDIALTDYTTDTTSKTQDESQAAASIVAITPPALEPLTLKCRLCGRVYCVGEDATVITDENVRASVAVTIVFTGPTQPIRTDLVGALEDHWDQERREIEKRKALDTLRMIRDTVKRGQRRYWYCDRCDNHKTPFEYPQL